MIPGICRYCTCEEHRACEGGCHWADPDRTLCSLCAAAIDIVEKFLEIFAAVGPRARPPIPLGPIEWELLEPAQQQLLVMACRRTVEAYRETLRDELADDAIAHASDLGAIGDFLEQHFPAEMVDEAEPLSAIVVRLLLPHAGARIVLADGARL